MNKISSQLYVIEYWQMSCARPDSGASGRAKRQVIFCSATILHTQIIPDEMSGGFALDIAALEFDDRVLVFIDHLSEVYVTRCAAGFILLCEGAAGPTGNKRLTGKVSTCIADHSRSAGFPHAAAVPCVCVLVVCRPGA